MKEQLLIETSYSQLSADIKMNNYKIKTSLLAQRSQRPGLTKVVLILQPLQTIVLRSENVSIPELMQNLCGYYGMGNIVVNLGCFSPCHLLVSSFIQQEWRGESLFYYTTSFTFLEYKIIWCKIQVMINPFIPGCPKWLSICMWRVGWHHQAQQQTDRELTNYPGTSASCLLKIN